MMQIKDLVTPALLLDEERVRRNCARMAERATMFGVALRPHMKTAKSAAVARVALGDLAPRITVSTVAEAGYFAKNGFRDITYAVGITADKVAALAEVARNHDATITLIADSVPAVTAAGGAAKAAGASFRMLVEIDSGGGRGGVTTRHPALLAVAEAVAAESNLLLGGVLTHAGQSYHARSVADIIDIAETERVAVVSAAERLRQAGFSLDTVSVGSTPTALFAARLDGVTEMRPGVYTLFDLDQVGLGTCTIENIAACVLATVIGHNPRSESILIDAGGLALSKDRSAAKRDPSIGYGLICPAFSMMPYPGVAVAELHQEHGFVRSSGSFEELSALLPIGSKVRVLPSHVCMTSAQFSQFYVMSEDGQTVIDHWARASGWVSE